MLKKSSLKSLLLGLVGWVVLASSSSAMAQEVAPDALVKRVTDEVLTIVRQDKDIQNGNSQKAVALVETKVSPNFDFARMTGLAMGREWNKASPDQKKALTQEFRTLLIRTYSNALSSYKDQTIEYKPFKGQAADTDVVVRTQINQPGGKPVELEYNLEKTAEGWKVYDVVVAGVSLVTNYRESFGQEVRSNGVDSLIKSLAAKNKTLEAGAKK